MGENGYGVAIYLMMVQTPLLAFFVCGQILWYLNTLVKMHSPGITRKSLVGKSYKCSAEPL